MELGEKNNTVTKNEIIDEDELKNVMPKIFKRSQIDEKFRELCIRNPGQAIYELTGKKLPDGAKLSFSN